MMSPVGMLFGLPEQQGQQGPEKKSDPVGVAHFIASVHLNCITVFTRTGFGVEGLGIPGVLSGVLLVICAAAEPLMVIWLIAWILAAIVQRINTFKLLRQGVEIHSRFGGRSLLLKIPFLRNERHITMLEAGLCLVLGILLLAVSQFVGVFMALGFLTITIRYGIEETIRDRRHQRMRDARIEANYYRDGL